MSDRHPLPNPSRVLQTSKVEAAASRTTSPIDLETNVAQRASTNGVLKLVDAARKARLLFSRATSAHSAHALTSADF